MFRGACLRCVSAHRLRWTHRNPSQLYTSSQFTPSGARDRAAVGPFTPTAAAVFVLTGVGLYFYFEREKQLLVERRQKELQETSAGRPSVGGPFYLTAHTGKPFTEKDLIGKWDLVYFGFTNCPDICPTELDKMGEVVSSLESTHGSIFRPIFISVDPARDTLPKIAKYLADFHPSFIGATEPSLFQTTATVSSSPSATAESSASKSYPALRSVCKAYRVYFSTPPDADPHGDYLVDHSIFIYLMDPQGEFVEAFGQAKTATEIVERVEKEIELWQKKTGRKV